MAELIKKLYKVRDNISGKAFQRRPNELPSFYQTSRDFPAMNVLETRSGYRIDMAIPGFKKEDIKIDCDKDVLGIKVHYKGQQGRSRDTKEGDQKFSILRTIRIPDDTNKDKINASMKNGLLSIELPAKDTSVKNKSISINVG